MDGAARRLRARAPSGHLGELFERTFALPGGDPRYAGNALVPGALPLEVSFSEGAPEQLRFDVEPFGPLLAARERLAQAEHTLRAQARQSFPPATTTALDAVFEPWHGRSPGEAARFGAFFGAVLDGTGLAELKLYRETGPVESLPSHVKQEALAVSTLLPGVEPHLHSIAVGRGGVAERLYLLCRQGLRLRGLERLAAEAGMTGSFPAFLQTVTLLTGGRLVLPPDSAIIGVRRKPDGWELKLELLPGALAPSHVARRAAVEQVLAGRPEAWRAFRRWMEAVRPEGTTSAGEITVVSVRVAPSTLPALNVYLCPSTPFRMEERPDDAFGFR
ncbi:hypothetical protein [Corallococcus sicarius]|uniref:Uncharacterized protein n=1 Tax=Corallococcus sicarius TaxID=2316726 RepID=A0A3A8NTE7_9BACT|nr:hypothetical protein [Corallococcus sicarius]RKH47666.1 hypothetical protein D7X12_02045 [Corallococcus sicarius]